MLTSSACVIFHDGCNDGSIVSHLFYSACQSVALVEVYRFSLCDASVQFEMAVHFRTVRFWLQFPFGRCIIISGSGASSFGECIFFYAHAFLLSSDSDFDLFLTYSVMASTGIFQFRPTLYASISPDSRIF